MKRLVVLLSILPLAVLSLVAAPPATADSSHARIVRLSLVQGDVRFSHEFHKDSLTDAKAEWEIAPLNLPIREGYALSTGGSGRAEIEFENGAMAFLSGNSLIEFYDLSLDDGAHITRLILRQGSAIFYVQPANGDYFSVTGGDFSVEADGRTTFRLDNFDDGSNVNVEQGHIKVLRNHDSKFLEKGQSYSINVNAGGSAEIGRSPDSDDFDKWVSGRIDSVATATNYASQYVSSPSYSSGFADLYNYGSFYNLPGYGYGWQPFGMGLGWSPFSYGSWYSDPFFGVGFISSAPWGWLPYHYGGWVFNPVYGWVWLPTGLGSSGPIYYRPVTGIWVHSGTATGLVPLHPADGRGRTPVNLAQGVYALHENSVAATPTSSAGETWSVIKNPPRDALTTTALASTTPPARVTRTILSGNSGSRSVTLSRNSSIVYDAGQHRFVNSSEPAQAPEEGKTAKTETGPSDASKESASAAALAARTPNAPPSSREAVHARPAITPPTPPAHSASATAGSGTWNGNPNGFDNSASPSSHTTTTGSSGHSSGGHH